MTMSEIVIRDARTQCRLQWPPGASQQQGADRRLGAQRALRPGASEMKDDLDYYTSTYHIFTKAPDKLEKETFQNIFLDVSHARLVNEHWELGKNEKSLKYVERCLQNFAGFGILSSEGKPISWFLTEQSCEIRMGYTFPKYRGQGHMWQMGCHSIAYFFSRKIPFYIHVAEDKEKSHQALLSFGFKNALCGWHQWKCTPKRYC
ncbi:PREDICTED: glycine N-acyltransferase-like protein 2 [Bison bison bison]|uniref:Glycine N-acyltransferase-like protein n=1 Tax=Bison bison bison TaxID=43346 RepID=A0A6P3H943_BISBB|nr:PREDICTED: glycine N-acyltransferase-like protein 2 [Bison bison bison]